LRWDDQSLQVPAEKAEGDLFHHLPPGGPQAGVPVGRDHQIPLGAVRRQLHRDSAHAVPPRQHRVHLLPGGVPDGVRLLCLHHRRQGPGPDPGGDAGPGAVHPKRLR
ncbi:DeoR family transcriptional regulator, partial [Dysosmobacter welbionis]